MVLTPVMRRLLERGGPVTEFSQSVLLEVPAGLGAAALTAALQAVIDHHAMLRARLVSSPGGGGWRFIRRARWRPGNWCGGWTPAGWPPVRWPRRWLPSGWPRSGALPRKQE